MKPTHSEETQRVLILLQLDATNLLDRIVTRRKEYLHRFNLSRRRDHFADIFENRYEELKMQDLKSCSEEVIVSADKYYTLAEKLYWYFKQTEDMEVAAEDYSSNAIEEIKNAFDIFSSFLRAEITGATE